MINIQCDHCGKAVDMAEYESIYVRDRRLDLCDDCRRLFNKELYTAMDRCVDQFVKQRSEQKGLVELERMFQAEISTKDKQC